MIRIRAHRAVVVGDAGEAFHYASLNRAFRELIDGAKLIALAKNRSFKDADGTTKFGCRSICSGAGICEPAYRTCLRETCAGVL